MKWKNSPPVTADLNGQSEEYFWVTGGNFNRMVLVRANNGVTSHKPEDGPRVFRAEVNFSFYTENYPNFIWASDLHKWNFHNLQWAGPVPRPNK